MSTQPTLTLVFEGDVTMEQVRDAGGWQALGACRPGQMDNPEVMWPETRGKKETAPGKKVCAGCPMLVRQLCREENWSEPYGTWGGMTQWEREAAKNAERQRRFRENHAATA